MRRWCCLFVWCKRELHLRLQDVNGHFSWFPSCLEHTMATPLEDVGKQVWQGALLLADYILFRRDLFQGRTVLELGAGTGFASIVAATMARTVYCTDVGADLLAMCQRNITLNSHLAAAGDVGSVSPASQPVFLAPHLRCPDCLPCGIKSGLSEMQAFAPLRKPAKAPVPVQWYREGQGAGLAKGQPVHSQLWTWSQCAGQRPAWQCLLRQAASNPFSCPETSLGQTLGEAWWPAEKGLGPSVASPADPEVPFSWSEEDISDLYDHTTVLFAAEVFYDDSLTDALFRTLHRLTRRLKNACTALLSVERRFNFTLRHLDVTCEAYDHFRSSLHALEKLSDSKLRFVVEPVEASFPQLLIYERIRQLELWKIIAEPTA
ncbi:PREDICTED: methyltransferase-like protein 22 isoform X6 [Chinchilla lanigera]|uniref:methyltransferase-like protein 22 isoform X6 n=1 Tax=Chinchilla lanigera TaxID=34839 RepID=UPI000697E0AA|nr:PREDICTED: methyltransferase-like protein 22 isoform X6 [Chinchilla lanigera]